MVEHIEDIANEAEAALGYELRRTVLVAQRDITAWVAIYHRGDLVAQTSHTICDVASARAHDLVADRIAVHADEADAQASVAALFDAPGLSFAEAKALQADRKLAEVLAQMADDTLAATARNIALVKGMPWAEVLRRLTNLRDDYLGERDEVAAAVEATRQQAAIAEPAIAALKAAYGPHVRTARVLLEQGGMEAGADCPWCVGGVVYHRYGDDPSDRYWKLAQGCEHSIAWQQSPYARLPELPAYAAFLPAQPVQPPAQAAEQRDAMARLVADQLRLSYEWPGCDGARHGELYGLSADQLAAAISAIAALEGKA